MNKRKWRWMEHTLRKPKHNINGTTSPTVEPSGKAWKRKTTKKYLEERLYC